MILRSLRFWLDRWAGSAQLVRALQRAIFGGRDADDGLKLSRERAMIGITAVLCNLGYAPIAGEQVCRVVEADLDHQLLGSQVEDALDVALKLRHRDVGDASKLLHSQRLSVVLVDIGHRCGDAPVNWVLLIGHAQVARDAGEADNLSIAS